MTPSSAPRLCVFLMTMLALVSSARSAAEPTLQDKQWNHGSEDCAENRDPAIEIYAHSPTSFILRQNKCLNFEAPFMYLLIGEERALLLDTGATEEASEVPLYETVRDLIGDRALLVVHSHGHGDHRSADTQFENAPGVTVVGIDKSALIDALSISQWPDGQGSIDLGNRQLTVIPSPGHQEEAITLYDPQTQWLLTGDTLYPGLVYVKDWNDYRDSIARLARFADTYTISALLGAHIEATNRPGDYYPIGSQYQPEEAPLPLAPATLATINAELQLLPEAKQIDSPRLKVIPMNVLQRRLSDLGRWMSQ